MNKIKLKVGDPVKVITGDFYGLIDKISQIEPKKQQIYLKKATRKQYDKNPENKKKSELKEVAVAIPLSNVAYWLVEKKKITKIGWVKQGEKKVRQSKKYNVLIKETLHGSEK